MTNSVQVHGIVFQPMTKRFMVWDKGLDKFLEHAGEKVYDLPLLTDLLDTYNVVEIYEDLVIVQSTNIFDEDGKEIFEGSIVEANWGLHTGSTYIDNSLTGIVKNMNGVWCITEGDSDEEGVPLGELPQEGLTLLGHILSNPELLEEK